MHISITQTTSPRIINTDLSQLAMGQVFTDHMAIVEYENGAWVHPRVMPYGPISLFPAAMSLHYGQAVFEGMKVYKNEAGIPLGFRLSAHSQRLNRSCARLMIPEIPEELFRDLFKALIRTDVAWIPNGEGSSLYIRPFVFATEPALGVRPSTTYTFMIIASPASISYYTKPLSLKVEETYSRACPGGVGSAKAAGNYAAALLPTALAGKEGFDQILWTDSSTHSYVEESGTMNICFVIDGKLLTPALGDTILHGITRDSLITLARDRGIAVDERRITVEEVCAACADGSLTEAFGVGTAVVVSPIASITYKGKMCTIPVPTDQSICMQLKTALTDIRCGRVSDTHGWVEAIA